VTRLRLAGPFVLAAVTALLPAAARAGGYDTPMLYSARHMGMGGTAIGYVNEPSAIFHNPAGLAQIGSLAATGDFTLLLAKVRSSPNVLVKDTTSKQTVAPLGLVGGGLRLNEIVTVGLAVYPIALAGATYEYPPGKYGGITEDRTRLAFVEASPAVAFNLPARVRLGAGYRVTYTSIERFAGNRDDLSSPPFLDFRMTGLNWAGFRVGAQWTPLDWLQVGAVYRHKTKTKVTNDKGIAVGVPFTDIDTTFVLPAKAGAGVRADFGYLGIAVDGEYLFNEQNKGYPLNGLPPAPPGMAAMRTSVPNYFLWKNETTIRAGLELRTGFVRALERLAVRGGYVYDGKTTNPVYPSAFGTPPGPTNVITGGLGWKGVRWQVNAAYAYRFGTGQVTPADIMMQTMSCQFCSAAGNLPYKINVHGLYFDFSYAY
jgi:long-chain fatty acid transport protein